LIEDRRGRRRVVLSFATTREAGNQAPGTEDVFREAPMGLTCDQKI
jgi:hypothetical protein